MLLILDFDETLGPTMLNHVLDKSDGRFKETVNASWRAHLHIGQKIPFSAKITGWLSVLNTVWGSEGLSEAYVEASKLELFDGVLEALKGIRARYGHTLKMHIVTLGFVEFIQRHAIANVVDGIHGSTLAVRGSPDGLIHIGDLKTEWWKVLMTRELMKKYSLDYPKVVAIGDGETDLPLFEDLKLHGGTTIGVYKSVLSTGLKDKSDILIKRGETPWALTLQEVLDSVKQGRSCDFPAELFSVMGKSKHINKIVKEHKKECEECASLFG